MSKVIHKFLLASMFMWMTPILILYGFNHKIFPGSSQLSSSTHTLLSGFIAVIAVNVVIIFYIVMAMKEPSTSEPQPDPAFLAKARASVNQSSATSSSDNAPTRVKEE